MIKAIALDFDNTIILDPKSRTGSEEIKDAAWKKVYKDQNWSLISPVITKVQIEIAGGNGDRKTIAKRVAQFMGINSQEAITQEVKKRCSYFNTIVQAGIKNIGIQKNDKDSLTALSSHFSLYINTATPVTYLETSLKNLKIDHIFKGVLGRPESKLNNLKEITKTNSLHPQELLFVDDAIEGFNIAKTFGCHFIGMHTSRNTKWHTKKHTFPIIYSLKELFQIIQKINTTKANYYKYL